MQPPIPLSASRVSGRQFPVAGTLDASAILADDNFPASLWAFTCDVLSLVLVCLLDLQDVIFKLNFRTMSVHVA